MLGLWDTKRYVTMNYFNDLPDDIQEKIFKCAHKIKFDICLYRINNHFDEHFLSGALKNMALHLYSTGVSNFELNNYFQCLDWLDGNIPFDYDESRNNVYYRIFEDYWLSYFHF